MSRCRTVTNQQSQLITLYNTNPAIDALAASEIIGCTRDYVYQVFRWIKNGMVDRPTSEKGGYKNGMFCLERQESENVKLTCLRCDKTFKSEDHKSNRLCGRCRKVNEVFSCWV